MLDVVRPDFPASTTALGRMVAHEQRPESPELWSEEMLAAMGAHLKQLLFSADHYKNLFTMRLVGDGAGWGVKILGTALLPTVLPSSTRYLLSSLIEAAQVCADEGASAMVSMKNLDAALYGSDWRCWQGEFSEGMISRAVQLGGLMLVRGVASSLLFRVALGSVLGAGVLASGAAGLAVLGASQVAFMAFGNMLAATWGDAFTGFKRHSVEWSAGHTALRLFDSAILMGQGKGLSHMINGIQRTGRWVTDEISQKEQNKTQNKTVIDPINRLEIPEWVPVSAAQKVSLWTALAETGKPHLPVVCNTTYQGLATLLGAGLSFEQAETVLVGLFNRCGFATEHIYGWGIHEFYRNIWDKLPLSETERHDFGLFRDTIIASGCYWEAPFCTLLSSLMQEAESGREILDPVNRLLNSLSAATPRPTPFILPPAQATQSFIHLLSDYASMQGGQFKPHLALFLDVAHSYPNRLFGIVSDVLAARRLGIVTDSDADLKNFIMTLGDFTPWLYEKYCRGEINLHTLKNTWAPKMLGYQLDAARKRRPVMNGGFVETLSFGKGRVIGLFHGGGGTLTPEEIGRLQSLANRHHQAIDVFGSRARGEGRHIYLENFYPYMGKRPGSRSDIDMRTRGEVSSFPIHYPIIRFLPNAQPKIVAPLDWLPRSS